MSGRRARAIRALLTVALGRPPYGAHFVGYHKKTREPYWAPRDEARAARRAWTRGRRTFEVHMVSENVGVLRMIARSVREAFRRPARRAA